MPTETLRSSFAAAFDRLNAEEHRAWLDQLVVNVSIIGFLAHLALIFLTRTLPNAPTILTIFGKNYLSAIYTPFSFILFYEVLMLIAALPESTTQSIAKQYEIVSLIFMRRFFKDIAELDDISKLTQFSPDVRIIFIDVVAGVFMFLLVTVFLHAGRKRVQPDIRPEESAALKKFISRKKAIALGLSVLLVSLAVYSLVEYAFDAWNVAHGAKARIDPNTFFYTRVFTVMIFTDVLIVILSLDVSDRYELVFRNGAFVISTILIRFSLAVARPYGAALALTGMLFGIFTLVVYNYHGRVTSISGSKTS